MHADRLRDAAVSALYPTALILRERALTHVVPYGDEVRTEPHLPAPNEICQWNSWCEL